MGFFLSVVVGFGIGTMYTPPLILPQGTLVEEKNIEIQKEFNRLTKGEISSVRIGKEDATLIVLDDFSSGRSFGIGGGSHCKAYRMLTREGTKEVGVMCKSHNSPNNVWTHVSWRKHFRRLS